VIWCTVTIAKPRDRAQQVYARSWWAADLTYARAQIARELTEQSEVITDLAATVRGRLLPLDFVTVLMDGE
jgi:hypothetical protein